MAAERIPKLLIKLEGRPKRFFVWLFLSTTTDHAVCWRISGPSLRYIFIFPCSQVLVVIIFEPSLLVQVYLIIFIFPCSQVGWYSPRESAGLSADGTS